MDTAALSFVLTDRVADFDATCAAAGFDHRGARRFSALYSGLRRSERRIARALAERLWLPISFEPSLSAASLGLDDEPAPEERPSGAAALALARRHAGSCIALALGSELADQIEAELRGLLPGGVAAAPAIDPSLRVLQLELAPEAVTARALDAYLLALGADRVAHPGGSLIDHLRRTAQQLARWHARPALVRAGLCHAAYGTAAFAPALVTLGERVALAQRIGVEAEALVYAYAACDRAAGYPSAGRPWLRDRFSAQTLPVSPQLARDLAELACANELDVLRHAGLDSGGRSAIAGMLRELSPLLGLHAARAVAAALEA